MGFSKLSLSAKFLNGVCYKVGRRLLSSEAGHQKQCSAKEPVKACVEKRDGLISKARTGNLLAVYKDEKGHFELSEDAKKFDAKVKGKISERLNVLGTDFELGKAFLLSDADTYDLAAIACFGPKDAGINRFEGLDEGQENARVAVAAGTREIMKHGNFAHVNYDESVPYQVAMGEAYGLISWTFEEFKKKSDYWCEGVGPDDFKTGIKLAAGQNWARWLSDMPANKMTPKDVGEAARKKLCPLKVDVTVHERDWIEAKNMQAFLTVSRGSYESPIFLECEYRGDTTSDNSNMIILLAGKGVTFDCGGLCLKRPMDMLENRASMAGASAVLGALYAIALLKLKMNVMAVIPLCENMISGQCMKVGDVVPALNGVNIQIEDTDMEGRLMLADALVYGQAKYKPDIIIDVATLTRGITTATGSGCYGCFTNRNYLWECAQQAGATSGDRPWQFPLWDYYRRQITDDPSVDLRNRGSGRGTPCLGAAFLQQFVCTGWLHFDVTGVGKIAHNPPPYLSAHRMSGRPTRTLVHTLQNIVSLPQGECMQYLMRGGQMRKATTLSLFWRWTMFTMTEFGMMTSK